MIPTILNKAAQLFLKCKFKSVCLKVIHEFQQKDKKQSWVKL